MSGYIGRHLLVNKNFRSGFTNRPSNVGISEGVFQKTFGLGLTLTPSNVRIYRRVLLQTIKYRKFHLPGFTNWGLKFGISERIKIFSDPWLTFTPPHFRISERNFKSALTFGGVNVRIYRGTFPPENKYPEGVDFTPFLFTDIWGDFSSPLHLDNWITCTSHRLCDDSWKARARQRCG